MKNFEFKTLLPSIYVLLVLIMLFLTVKILTILLPVTIAIIIVLLVNSISDKLKIKKKTFRAIVLSAIYILSVIVFFTFVLSILAEFINATYSIYKYRSEIFQDITNLVNTLGLPDKYFSDEYLYSYLEKGFSYLYTFSLNLANKAFTFTSSLPRVIFFNVVMILSSYIILFEYENILEFAKKQLPVVWINKINKIRSDVFKIMFNYLRVQCILIVCNAIQIIIGLNIINYITGGKIHYVSLMAIIVIIVDALPVLGAGSAFVPWAIISAINKEYKLAILLLVLFGIILCVRYLLEQRLIQKGTGFHPLISITSMYCGFLSFGLIGLLYGPLIAGILMIIFAEQIEFGFFKYLSGEKYDKENS